MSGALTGFGCGIISLLVYAKVCPLLLLSHHAGPQPPDLCLGQMSHFLTLSSSQKQLIRAALSGGLMQCEICPEHSAPYSARPVSFVAVVC